MADRLRGLSLVLLIGGGVAELIRLGAAYALYRTEFPSTPYLGRADDSFSFWWLPLGFAVFAFAAVIKYGCAMRAELDEVI